MRRTFLGLLAFVATGSFAFAQEQKMALVDFQGHWLASGCIGSSPFAMAFTISGDRVSWHAVVSDGKFREVNPSKAHVTAHADIVNGNVDLTVPLGDLWVHLEVMEGDKTHLVGSFGNSNLLASPGGADQLGSYYNARSCRK